MLVKLGVIKKLCWLNLQTHIYKWILGNFCCSHSGDLIFKHTSTIGFLTISTAPILAQSIANVYSAYDHSLFNRHWLLLWYNVNTRTKNIFYVFKHPPHFPGWPYLLLLCLSSVHSTSHTRTSKKIPEHPDLPCSNIGRMSLCLKRPSPTCMPSSHWWLTFPRFSNCPYLLYFLPWNLVPSKCYTVYLFSVLIVRFLHLECKFQRAQIFFKKTIFFLCISNV